MANYKLNSIEDAVKDFKEGKFVIVVDDEDRENEGDLIIAAEKIDAEKVNFMLKHARGIREYIGTGYPIHHYSRQTGRVHHRSLSPRSSRNHQGTRRP